MKSRIRRRFKVDVSWTQSLLRYNHRGFVITVLDPVHGSYCSGILEHGLYGYKFVVNKIEDELEAQAIALDKLDGPIFS